MRLADYVNMHNSSYGMNDDEMDSMDLLDPVDDLDVSPGSEDDTISMDSDEDMMDDEEGEVEDESMVSDDESLTYSLTDLVDKATPIIQSELSRMLSLPVEVDYNAMDDEFVGSLHWIKSSDPIMRLFQLYLLTVSKLVPDKDGVAKLNTVLTLSNESGTHEITLDPIYIDTTQWKVLK